MPRPEVENQNPEYALPTRAAWNLSYNLATFGDDLEFAAALLFRYRAAEDRFRQVRGTA
ncbi:hypothetical protein ACPOL_2709 [Acidisarcina polymorpha]|uniref:Uncharacterized protein n=1 Tax=Acidisarcina polymorpha TaxID=2211140 RepID=A0A2Z5FYZ0_9BACT|nr:hypothetical protein ACPOL_2709 [Acidisarcina polymorpha]